MANINRSIFSPAGSYVLSGTQANRPTAGTAGRLYLPTDGYGISRDNGSSWDRYVNGFKCSSTPAASSFTAVNNAEATLTDDDSGLIATLMGTNSGTEKVEVFLTSLPSAPYSFVVGIEFLWLYPLSYSMAGICLTNGTSTSNKLLWMGLMQLTTAVDLAIQKHSAFSTWDSNYLDIAACPPLTSGRIFFKISDDNSSRHFYMSQDGRIFTEVMVSHSRTDFLTATHAGIFLGQVTGSVATTLTRAKMRIFHWSLG